jgi:probable phosphomutase (TIGR03848 family)
VLAEQSAFEEESRINAMSTFIFLRHGHSAANAAGVLTGQLPGVGLSRQGEAQSVGLVERIGRGRVDFLHLSPIERCQLTIDPWLRSKSSSSLKSLQVLDGLSEIDFGLWSGRKLSNLRRDPLWKDVQNRPSIVTFPKGESFRKAQRRAVAAIDGLRAMPGRENVHLIVSHSDTIKLITAHYLNMKLDSFQKLRIDPASFTIFMGDAKNLSLATINSQSSLKEILG